MEISLPFAKLSSFQSLISLEQLREIELQMISVISLGWFADFGKTFTNSRPGRFILTNGKDPLCRQILPLPPTPSHAGLLFFDGKSLGIPSFQ